MYINKPQTSINIRAYIHKYIHAHICINVYTLYTKVVEYYNYQYREV